MDQGSRLVGRYRFVRLDLIEEKAAAEDDPRRIFYLAMLRCRTYEEYLALVRNHTVEAPGLSSRKITGRDEIIRARLMGWIADD
jgi:hypothetical protein